MDEARRRQLLAWSSAVAAVLAMFALLAWLPAASSGDDRTRLKAVWDLADGHGQFIKYSIVMSALAVVPYRVGRLLGAGDWVLEHFVLLTWVPWSLLLGARLARLRDAKFAVGVVTLSTVSMFSLYVTRFNVEAFELMLVSYGALLVLEDTRVRARVVGTALLAVAAACIPVHCLALGVVGVVMLRRRNPWFLVAAVLSVVLVVADATWSSGHLSFSKYPDEVARFPDLVPWGDVANFGFPFVFGLVSILFSFGRGLLWFVPGFFVRSDSAERDVVRTWRRVLTLFVAVTVPVYAKWWAWYGGFSFGPRFFLLAVVPAAVVVTERLQGSTRFGRWCLGVGLALWSAWVSVAGSSFYFLPRANYVCRLERFRYETLCWYAPEYSPLLGPLWEKWDLLHAETVYLVVAPLLVIALVVWLTPRTRWAEARSGAAEQLRSWRP